MSSASQMAMSALSEAQFQGSALEVARGSGWLSYHVSDSRKVVSSKGFPDVVLCHPVRGALFWEFKTETGRPSPDQKIWIQMLKESGQECEIVRPRYYDSYIIPRLLGKPFTLPSVTAGKMFA